MTYSAPARIDLAGGTLDIPPLCFLIENSLTLNLAINLRTSVHLEENGSGMLVSNPPKPLRDMPLYSKTLDYFCRSQNLDVRVESDIPQASGLGGSSTLLTALVRALEPFTEDTSEFKEKLLGHVTVLEHRLLGKPAGTQDAIAAIYGGLSEIDFNSGAPSRKPMKIPSFLQGPLYLAYSKIQHHSGINNWAIIRDACEGDASTLSTLNKLNNNSHDMKVALEQDDRHLFFDCLLLESKLRTHLCRGVCTSDMDQFLSNFNHKMVGKVCGAGGGGCMFIFGQDEEMDLDALNHVARKCDMEILTVEADQRGCFEERP